MDGSLSSDWKSAFAPDVAFFGTQNAFQINSLGAGNDPIFVLREFAVYVLGWLPRGFVSGQGESGLAAKAGWAGQAVASQARLPQCVRANR